MILYTYTARKADKERKFFMKYEEIVAKAKDIMSEKDLSGYAGHLAVQINITGEGEGIFYIEILDGKAYVEPYDYKDNDCVLISSADDLLKIVSGALDPVAAFTTGKLKIGGSIDKALEFQKATSKLKAAAPKTAKSAAQKPAKSKKK